MLGSHSALASPTEANSASGSLEDDVEVHTEDTGEGVVLDAQIDVLLDAEAEVSSIREVLLLEFSVLDLETSLQNLICLLAADGHVHGDLFVPLDAETSDGESSSGGHGLLASEIFQDLASCIRWIGYPW